MAEKRGKAYILNQKIDHEFNAAGKAMQDVFCVFKENGVKIMPGVPKSAPKYLKVLDIPILLFYLLIVLGKRDYCIFSFPENHFKIKLISRLSKIRKVNTVCFINDINSIRDGNFDKPEVQALIRRDMELIGSASIIMAPNNNSRKFLISQGITSQIISVGTWDYLMEENVEIFNAIHKTGEKWLIAFAGNLDKAPFINQLDQVSSEQITFQLWGKSNNPIMESRECRYMGSMAPEELPLAVSKCHFGLVWDGISVHSCEGGLGEYLKYNNSHKCGLYLASGLPVFVWEESGLADFVKENQCGYVIQNLDEIDAILQNMTEQEYETLLSHVQAVSQNVRKGYYLKQALEACFL